MMTENISFQVQMSDAYEEAMEKVTAALKAEGFGILTQIDVRATLKKKLDKDFRPYAILGACNPPLAHKALETDPIIGVMLPCNVTVEANQQGTLVNLVNPKMMLLSHPLLQDNPTLQEVALDAYQRLERVAQTLRGDS
jgi:uncharacterized protein (DUF302 family)